MLLSGPEPQRSYLENILLKQAGTLKIRSLLVRGVPGEGNKRRWEGSVEVVDYLSAGELSEVVAASELVLCRSGYSTLMDLAELDKRAILIPTPGQTEQEYLARQLYDRRICLYRPQQNLNLEHIMVEADEFPGFTPMPSNPLKLRDAATEFLQRL
jgi:UDP-N-acetylglucosamine:LPS N-acetylglucosamine transferase